MSELTEREQDKLDEIVLDLADEERYAAEDAAAMAVAQARADAECGGEHCGNDCGGTYANDGTGEWDEPEECVHCFCCTCTPCEYARVA